MAGDAIAANTNAAAASLSILTSSFLNIAAGADVAARGNSRRQRRLAPIVPVRAVRRPQQIRLRTDRTCHRTKRTGAWE
jgi:hypothetical protein